jgi:hypothetical protein
MTEPDQVATTLYIGEEDALEAVAGVMMEAHDWLPANPYGVAARVLDALGWPRVDGSRPSLPSVPSSQVPS